MNGSAFPTSCSLIIGTGDVHSLFAHGTGYCITGNHEPRNVTIDGECNITTKENQAQFHISVVTTTDGGVKDNFGKWHFAWLSPHGCLRVPLPGAPYGCLILDHFHAVLRGCRLLSSNTDICALNWPVVGTWRCAQGEKSMNI